MAHCASCGHALEVGRYCTNCGRAVTGSTADERAPVVPPTAASAPGDARFPLFADEPRADPPAGPPPGATTTSVAASPPVAGGHSDRRRRAPWLPWALTAVALVLVGALGVSLLFASGPGSDEAVDAALETDQPSQPPTSAPSAPSGVPTPDPTGPTDPSKPQDVAALATVETPTTAEPNQDVSGDPVRYENGNMLDGVATTAWRMPGDGSGLEIVIGLAEEIELTRIGLVNGYAKRDGEFDWYAGNRRITQVQWLFDDGSVVDQDLTERRRLQSLDIDPVVTRSVRLRLVEVSSPGKGRSGRDYTAISELALVGAPA